MISVTAAVLIKDNRILLAQRKLSGKQPGKWEFPGGKIEKSETPEECLKRELKEEFNIEVEIKDYFDTNIHQYSDLKIKLIAYKVEWKNGNIESKAHNSYKWISINEIEDYDFAEADIPFVKKLKKELL